MNIKNTPTDSTPVNQASAEPQLELPTIPTKPAASKKRNKLKNYRTILAYRIN
jgi:hypothetical protein